MGGWVTGDPLGARLELLVRAANHDLPIVSAAFARVAGKLQTTESDVSGAFWRPAEFEGGGADKHVAAVAKFAGIVIDCVKSAEHSIELTADALRIAAQEYSRTDQQAGRALTDLMKGDRAEDGSEIPDLKLPL
ncbi:hypothetical protein [Hamadaea tsunoensis]|uniref:hypothetical protein n=1 Tax=Hamadaea tsunoensis TaxID=53368 RepID=UPI0004010E5F|nr:hypothetical protein [Hamadaea tsunoensis]